MKQTLFILSLTLLFNLMFHHLLPGQSDSLQTSANSKMEKNFKVQEKLPYIPDIPGCEEISDPISKVTCFHKVFLEHVHKNLKYPDLVKGKTFEKTAIIRLKFDKDDEIYCADILRDPGYGTGKAILTAVHISIQELSKDYKPCRWKPSISRGNPIGVSWTFPIKIEQKRMD